MKEFSGGLVMWRVAIYQCQTKGTCRRVEFFSLYRISRCWEVNNYLSIRQKPHPATAGPTRNKAKKRDKKKKTDRCRRRNPPPPIQAIDACMGEEEKNRKQKEEQKKKNGRGASTQVPGPFSRLLLPAWIIRWVYSETPAVPGEGNKQLV